MRALPLLLLLACSTDPVGEPFSFAEPGDAPSLRGPGGPAVPFEAAQLWENCAFLVGGPEDLDHHNLVMPYRGHLVMPWASEWGVGGLSFFDLSDPCAPIKVSDSYETTMRETHAIGFVHLPDGDPHAGDYAAVNQQHGLLIWDVTDASAPVVASVLEYEEMFWPDAYARVALSVFWQYPYVFLAAADNGLYVIDATDPYAPVPLARHVFEPGLRAGGVFVVGNVALVSGAEQSSAALLDVSDPAAPQPIPGGRFALTDDEGNPREAYHATLVGDLALFTRKEGAGGILLYDVSDPTAPVRLGDAPTEHNGGYVFVDEGFAFVGESSIANVFDVRDPANPVLVGSGWIEGDLDTVVPYGNVAVLSADDEAIAGEASAVMPWTTDVDTVPPAVLRVDPRDGATGVPVTARVGVAFSEPIEPSTVFAGSIRLYAADGAAVAGWGSGQEVTASYAPKEPLRPGTTYTVHVMAGGVTDVNGNAVAETVTTTFTTAGP